MEALEKMVHFNLCWMLKEFLIQVCYNIHFIYRTITIGYDGIHYCTQVQFFFFFFPLLYSVEGPGAMASKICMDKVATSVALKHVCFPNSNLFSLKDKEESFSQVDMFSDGTL